MWREYNTVNLKLIIKVMNNGSDRPWEPFPDVSDVEVGGFSLAVALSPVVN